MAEIPESIQFEGDGCFAQPKKHIAGGKTGNVYIAEIFDKGRKLDGDWVIKLPHVPQAAAMLAQEAAMFCKVNGEGDARVLIRENGTAIIIMKKKGDTSLKTAIRSPQQCDDVERVGIFLQILKRLKHLQDKQLSHTDIKPNNITIDEIRNEKGDLLGFGDVYFIDTDKCRDYGVTGQIGSHRYSSVYIWLKHYLHLAKADSRLDLRFVGRTLVKIFGLKKGAKHVIDGCGVLLLQEMASLANAMRFQSCIPDNFLETLMGRFESKYQAMRASCSADLVDIRDTLGKLLIHQDHVLSPEGREQLQAIHKAIQNDLSIPLDAKTPLSRIIYTRRRVYQYDTRINDLIKGLGKQFQHQRRDTHEARFAQGGLKAYHILCALQKRIDKRLKLTGEERIVHQAAIQSLEKIFAIHTQDTSSGSCVKISGDISDQINVVMKDLNKAIIEKIQAKRETVFGRLYTWLSGESHIQTQTQRACDLLNRINALTPTFDNTPPAP